MVASWAVTPMFRRTSAAWLTTSKPATRACPSFGSASVVPADITLEVEESATKEESGHDTRNEARSRHVRIAQVDSDLTNEKMPKLDPYRCLLIESDAVPEGWLLFGLANDVSNGTLTRVDGFNLLLQDDTFGRGVPAFDKAVRLSGQSVSWWSTTPYCY